MPGTLTADDLAPGFADPVGDSQRTFRAALDAMSYPGRVLTVEADAGCPPLQAVQAALALALIDYETPVWLDAAAGPAASWLRFHCGCRIVAEPASARFAFVADPGRMPPLSAFDAGSDQFPDRSATIVIALAGLSGGQEVRLSGPGIRDDATIAPLDLTDDFWSWWAENNALFPRGVDVFLTAGDRLAGLPRTVRARTDDARS